MKKLSIAARKFSSCLGLVAFIGGVGMTAGQRESDDGTDPSFAWALGEDDLRVMEPRNAPANRQAKAGAGLLLLGQAVEAFKHTFAQFGRNTRAIIGNRQL